MLQLASNQTLSAATIQKLADLQALIDAETLFAAKAEKAKSLWNAKPRNEFTEVKTKLLAYIYQRLDLLIKILETTSTQEIENLLTPHDNYLDKTLTLQNQKDLIKNGFKNDILSQAHPSVWYAIKMVESKVNTKWQAIFTALPEIANW